jgi:hypothetical protein
MYSYIIKINIADGRKKNTVGMAVYPGIGNMEKTESNCRVAECNGLKGLFWESCLI